MRSPTNFAHSCPHQVRNCLKALEVLEAASPGLLPDPQRVMDFLIRPPLAPAPATTPALAWHEAAVACLRLDDPVGMARLCNRIYSSKVWCVQDLLSLAGLVPELARLKCKTYISKNTFLITYH